MIGIRQVLIDLDLSERIRREAIKIVTERYTSAAMAREYNDVYKAVLERY